jgi:hypothetical protein
MFNIHVFVLFFVREVAYITYGKVPQPRLFFL